MLVIEEVEAETLSHEWESCSMNKMDWIKDLVLAEQKMEDSGLVDLSSVNPDAQLEEQTLELLAQIKTAMIEGSSAFNQMKGSTVGTLKIYGISNTKADFMLFRNGYKLIFSMKRAGEIEIYDTLLTTHYLASTEEAQSRSTEKDVLRAHWGAFGEVQWHHKSLPVKLDFLVRHYMTKFIRESSKWAKYFCFLFYHTRLIL